MPGRSRYSEEELESLFFPCLFHLKEKKKNLFSKAERGFSVEPLKPGWDGSRAEGSPCSWHCCIFCCSQSPDKPLEHPGAAAPLPQLTPHLI